jgi:alpha-ribazole phosphatase
VTRLFLIRHGNTIDEETKKIYKGSIDIPLSQAGINKIRKAAAFMSAFSLDKIYTSTLSRSIESGRIIAEAQKMTFQMLPSFNEVNFGVWEGLSFEEIKQQYPREFSLWIEDPGTHPPPGGESFRSARKRSMAEVKRIVAAHEGQTIAVVAHAGILRIMIFSLLRMRLSRLFRIAQDYGCINIVDIYEDGNSVVNLLNFTHY